MGDAPQLTLDLLERALFSATPPVVIGRFEVLRQLGRGGMGVVYLARDPQLKREVAIKVHRGHDARARARARLRTEAETLARLRHRNIVTVHEVGELEGGDVFVVMEYLPGRTLREWFVVERPPWAALLSVFTRCARGLQAAHDAGLLHRDIKPDNVILDDDGEPRIIDFGLAHAEPAIESLPTLDDIVEHSRDGAVAGTPRYMAPELWRGAPPSCASDQFAFAVTLYEAAAGHPPFDDPREATALQRPREVPRRQWPTLARALEATARARWPSMSALASRLEQVEQRGHRRTRALTAAAAATTVGAALAGGAALLRPGVEANVVAAASPPAACVVGDAYLDAGWSWRSESDAVVRDDDGLRLELPVGPPRFIHATLEGPAMSLRDRSITFELTRVPRLHTTHEVFLSVINGEDEAFSVLVYGGQWVFPMAPNTHGLALEIDRERDRFFRIQVRDQVDLPDIISFEYSADGAQWTPIARVEGNLANARVSISAGTHDPVIEADAVVVRAVGCGELAPLGPLSEDRDRARIEGRPR